MTKPDSNSEKRQEVLESIVGLYRMWQEGQITHHDTFRTAIKDVLEGCGQTRKTDWNDSVNAFRAGIEGENVSDAGMFHITDENLPWYVMQHGIIGLNWVA